MSTRVEDADEMYKCKTAHTFVFDKQCGDNCSYSIYSSYNLPYVFITFDSPEVKSYIKNRRRRLVLRDSRNSSRLGYVTDSGIIFRYDLSTDYSVRYPYGHMHTLNELKKDAIAYINQINDLVSMYMEKFDDSSDDIWVSGGLLYDIDEIPAS